MTRRVARRRPPPTRISPTTRSPPTPAILLFGGIETTEGMITNALIYLLEHPDTLARGRTDPRHLDAVIDESLRLEPAAAVSTATPPPTPALAGAHIGRGDLVRVSIAAANRDPDVFERPGRLRPRPAPRAAPPGVRPGPACVPRHPPGSARSPRRPGRAHAAPAEPPPGSRRPATVQGLVFRKPPALHARWDAA